jgi:hypothetical protein
MKSSNIFIEKIRAALLAFALCIASAFAQAPTRLDLYDGADNHLMFVTFEYDGQKNISRTVYMSDSTFVRKIMVERDEQGKSTREVSLNFNDDTSLTTNFHYSGDATFFSIADQFKVDQVGDTVSCLAGDPLHFSLSYKRTNTPAASIGYEKNNDGALTKVTISDNTGGPSYYGVFSYTVD